MPLAHLVGQNVEVPKANVHRSDQSYSDTGIDVTAHAQVYPIPFMGELLHYFLVEGLGLVDQELIYQAHIWDEVPVLLQA